MRPSFTSPSTNEFLGIKSTEINIDLSVLSVRHKRSRQGHTLYSLILEVQQPQLLDRKFKELPLIFRDVASMRNTGPSDLLPSGRFRSVVHVLFASFMSGSVDTSLHSRFHGGCVTAWAERTLDETTSSGILASFQPISCVKLRRESGRVSAPNIYLTTAVRSYFHRYTAIVAQGSGAPTKAPPKLLRCIRFRFHRTSMPCKWTAHRVRAAI
ncbi:hypothetical protein R3P38DRAFT_1321170 [Favolaschia claudopus]|uniref:Uncharacterized protein n=1 Tax=Favolaschia claudopus TaxID=2862362 RepID=A0AAW0AW74_9AGAR